MTTASRTRAGRPREFDEEAVLDALTRQFQSRGYYATTLSDLLTSSGLSKSSLYGAFGDKHRLFVRVLDRYATTRVALARADLEAPGSPLGNMRTFMRRICVEAHGGRGCLTANSALELLPGDGDVERIVARHQMLTRNAVADALDRAKAAGEIPAGRPTATLARYLFTVMEGLWELGRVDGEIEPLYDVVDATIRAVR